MCCSSSKNLHADVVVDLSAVLAVVHQQQVHLVDVGNVELQEAVGQQVLGLGVRSATRMRN